MKFDRIAILGVLSVLLLTGCGGAGGGSATVPESSSRTRNLTPVVALSTEISVVNGVNDLGLDLLGNISGNAVVAPFSASLTLARLRAGARGETLAALNGVMHLSGSGGEMDSAFNSLDLKINGQTVTSGGWTQARYGYLLTYLDNLAENYGLMPTRLDFALAQASASQSLSDWTFQASGIEGTVTTTNDTRLVLGDAVKLNSAWGDPFDPALTVLGTFEMLDSSTVEVPFMRKTAVVPHVSEEGYSALELSLSGGRQFLVVLPDKDRFSEVHASLTPELLQQIAAALTPTLIDLTLPRFTIASSSTFDLGVASTRGVADFSGIDGTKDLYASATMHHTRLSVTEAGLQANSVTLLALDDLHPETWTFGWNLSSWDAFALTPVDSVPIVLGRPFIFAVRDTASGAILFLGRVMNPSL